MKLFCDRIISIILLVVGNFMDNQTILEKLGDRVSQVLQHYHAVKSENEILQNELMKEKAQIELKDAEIEKLTTQNSVKDLEIEEIVNKIESILG